jgi:O-antigen/teichoic acid export membrane protein
MTVEPEQALAPSLTVRLAANTLVQAVGSGVAAVISFFTFVAVTRGLGPDAFGDFTAATVYLFIPVVLADVGLSTAVLREISADPDRTEPAMRASLPLRTLVSAGAIAISVAVALVMPFNAQTKSAVAIASVGAFLTLMTLSLLPVLQAQLKMHWAVGANLAGRLATLGLTLAAFAAGLGFKSYVAAYVAGIAVTFLLHVWAVARLVPLWPVIDTAYWRRLTAGALALGIAIALSQVYFRVDTVLLALLRSSEEVGYYGAAYKFIELLVLIPAAVGISMFPPLARFVATGDPRTGALVQKTFDVLLAASIPAMVLMLAYPEQILELSAGSEFSEAGNALRLLAPFAVFAFVNAVLWRVLMAADRDRELLAIAFFVLVVNVALNLIFIPVYGFEAAALITVVSEGMVIIPVALVVRRESRLPDLRYAPVVGAATAAMVAAILFLPGPVAVVGAVSSALYLAVLLLLPGTARDFVRLDLVPALRGRRPAP